MCGALLWAGTTRAIGTATVSGENMVTDNRMNGKGEGGAIWERGYSFQDGGDRTGHSGSL